MPQLLVLGLHHSGTSIVSKMLMSIGFYGGEIDDLLLRPDNPLKYWEHRDVVRIDQEWFDAHRKHPDPLPSWVGWKSPIPFGNTSFVGKVRALVRSMLQRSSDIVLKDPRMSVLARAWVDALPHPACVIVQRHPIACADSLSRYAPEVTTKLWAEVYAWYYTRISDACRNVPRMVVDHEDIVSDPRGVTRQLQTFASSIGASVVRDVDFEKFLRPRGAAFSPITAHYEEEVSEIAIDTWRRLRRGEAVSMAALPDSSTPSPLNETYATLVTQNDASYVLAAAVLGASIRALDSSRAMVAIVLPHVRDAERRKLSKAGWTIIQRSPIPEFWWNDCKDTTSAAQTKRWGAMMSKLWLWTLPYARVHYLDADSMLLRPAPLHTTSAFAAERGRHDGLFNAGIMSLVPNRVTFDRLLEIGDREKPPRFFRNIIDCTEQGLLNVAFRDASRMEAVRADDRTGTRSPSGVAIHWITNTCPKPWKLKKKPPSFCDARAYAIWTRYRHRLSNRLVSRDAEARDVSKGRRVALIDWLMLSSFVSLVVGLLCMRVIRRCRPQKWDTKAR